MAHAKQGDKVKFHYSATLEDGTVFDSTYEEICEEEECGCEDEIGPMELTIGAGEFFPEIEQALIGMAVGEKKKVMIPSADAFGEYDEEKVFTAKGSEIPEDLKPEVGDAYTLANDNDEEVDVTVVEVIRRTRQNSDCYAVSQQDTVTLRDETANSTCQIVSTTTMIHSVDGAVEDPIESVTFDSNHPLAGEDLNFEIELLEII